MPFMLLSGHGTRRVPATLVDRMALRGLAACSNVIRPRKRTAKGGLVDSRSTISASTFLFAPPCIFDHKVNDLLALEDLRCLFVSFAGDHDELGLAA